jgi:regulator of replication initiation timing
MENQNTDSTTLINEYISHLSKKYTALILDIIMLETRLNIVVKEKEILYNENETLKQKLTTYINKNKKQEDINVSTNSNSN